MFLSSFLFSIFERLIQIQNKSKITDFGSLFSF